MKPAEKQEQLQRWRDKLLYGLAENICRPCTDPAKEGIELDYNNPHQCGCRCKSAEEIILSVIKIEADIDKLNH